MDIGLLFWIVYIIAVLVYGVLNWPFTRATGASLVIFILIFLLGWRAFGFVVHN